MQPVLNIEDIKRVEAGLTNVGVSISELMHRAGTAAANEALRLAHPQSAVVLCGLGNNGGDGWVAAEELLSKGVEVYAVTPVEPDQIKGDLARVVAKSAQVAGVSIVVAPPRELLEGLLSDADVAIDAMLGTGFRGVPRAPFDIWIDCLNGSDVQVVSVDVPSGLSAQTGLAEDACVAADLTVTMLALKPGLLSDVTPAAPSWWRPWPSRRSVWSSRQIPLPGGPTWTTTIPSCARPRAPTTSSVAARCSWWEAPLASPAPP